MPALAHFCKIDGKQFRVLLRVRGCLGVLAQVLFWGGPGDDQIDGRLLRVMCRCAVCQRVSLSGVYAGVIVFEGGGLNNLQCSFWIPL